MSQFSTETLCKMQAMRVCSERAYPQVYDGRDRQAECVTEETNKCLGVSDNQTSETAGSASSTNMLQVSPAEMPKMLLATVGGGALGYYLGKGKGQNTQLLYAVVGLVAGFAVYKSFLQSPPKVVAEPAAQQGGGLDDYMGDSPNLGAPDIRQFYFLEDYTATFGNLATGQSSTKLFPKGTVIQTKTNPYDNNPNVVYTTATGEAPNYMVDGQSWIAIPKDKIAIAYEY